MAIFKHEAFPTPSKCSRAVMLAMAVALIPASGSLAQDGPSVIMGNSELGPRAATATDMRALAAEQGSIRVIVGLEMDFAREGGLDAAAADRQRATIASRQNEVLSLLAAPEAVTRFDTIPFVAMTLNPQDLDRILDSAGVKSVELDIPMPPSLKQSTGIVDAPKLWRQNAAGAGTSVAILDTGVRPNHRAFSGGKIVGSACYSRNTGISTSLCPNGRDEQVTRDRSRAGVDCDTSITGCGHGTHVAATAAGRLYKNHGMAREADIVAIQVFSEFASSSNCGPLPAPCVLSFTSDQVKGLERAMKWRKRYNIAAVNMSLGGGRFDGPCDDNAPASTAIIENLRSVGIATVIASGNSGYRDAVGAPACISAAIAAGSTTKQDDLSSFSNHASMVNLLAPGSGISAASADGGRRALTTKSGTSMAAPHIAGAFAMLQSHKPTASVDEIERALVCSGVTVTENNMPKPRISMVAARDYLDNPDTKKRWTFRRPQQVNSWTHMRGNWFHDGNAMRINVTGGAGWKITQAPFCGDNIRVDTKMKRKNPAAPATGYGTGVAISGEADTDGNFSGLFFLFYPFDDHLSAAIWEIDRSDPSDANLTANNLCFQSRALEGINAQGNLPLSVVKRGNELRFLINRTEVCSATTNSRFANGHVQAAMFAPRGEAGHSLRVFNLQAKSLGGSKGWEETNTVEVLQTKMGRVDALSVGANFQSVTAMGN